MDKFIISLIVVSLLLIGGVVWLQSEGGIGGAPEAFRGSSTNTSVNLGSEQEIATNTIRSANFDRVYAKICNTGETSAYVCLDASTCVFGEGIPLDAREGAATTTGDCFEITRHNLYTGAILGVVTATTSTTTVSVVEINE